jgi:hypothetical protein
LSPVRGERVISFKFKDLHHFRVGCEDNLSPICHPKIKPRY